jgi:hypothetical protein
MGAVSIEGESVRLDSFSDREEDVIRNQTPLKKSSPSGTRSL